MATKSDRYKPVQKIAGIIKGKHLKAYKSIILSEINMMLAE